MDKKRKVGRPLGSGKGRTVITSSISLTKQRWQKLDRIKSDKTRSAFIGEKIDKHKEKL